jgi:hypothetical protein
MQLDESENADRHDEDNGESFAALRLLFLAACFYVSIMCPTRNVVNKLAEKV